MGIIPKQTTESILVENSTYTWTGGLKKRLLKEGLLQYRCYICGLTEWLGKPISLQLDHENGVRSDCRIENLRLLCPNCHSQTPTFAGKRHKTHSCGTPIHYSSEMCRSCAAFKKYGTRPVFCACGQHISSSAVRCRKCEGQRRSGVEDGTRTHKTLILSQGCLPNCITSTNLGAPRGT